MSLPDDGAISSTKMNQVWAPLRDVSDAVVKFEADVKERFAALHTLLQQVQGQHQALQHLQQQQLHEADVTRRLLQRQEAHCSSLAAELREARHRHQAEVTALAQQRWRDAAVSRAARVWRRKVEARRAGDGREQVRALQSANAALRHELEALQRAVRASLLQPAHGAAGAYPAGAGGLYEPPASPSLSSAGTTDTGEEEPSSRGRQQHRRRPHVGDSDEEDRAGQQRGAPTGGMEPHTEGARAPQSEPQQRATQTDAEQQHPPRQQQPQQTQREPSQRTQEPLLSRHELFPPGHQRQQGQQYPVVMDYSENYLAHQQVEAQQRLQQPLPSLHPQQHQNQQAQFQQNPRFVSNATQAPQAQQPAAPTQSSSVRPLMDYRPDALRDESRARLLQLRQQRWPRPSLSALQRLNDNLRRAGADGGITGAVCDEGSVTHVHVCHCLGDRRGAAVEAVKENRPVMCPQCDPVQNSNFNHKIDVGKKSAPGKVVRTGGEVGAARERRDLSDYGNWSRGEQKVSVTKPVMESVIVERHRVV